ncbi:MAG: hypothetical protein ACOC3Y_00720, partial [Desulfohalobiaceae bacterium]
MAQKKNEKQGPKSPGSSKKKSPGTAKKTSSRSKTAAKKSPSRKSRASTQKAKAGSSRLAWLGSRLSLFLLGALFSLTLLALLLIVRSGPETLIDSRKEPASAPDQ